MAISENLNGCKAKMKKKFQKNSFIEAFPVVKKIMAKIVNQAGKILKILFIKKTFQIFFVEKFWLIFVIECEIKKPLNAKNITMEIAWIRIT